MEATADYNQWNRTIFGACAFVPYVCYSNSVSLYFFVHSIITIVNCPSFTAEYHTIVKCLSLFIITPFSSAHKSGVVFLLICVSVHSSADGVAKNSVRILTIKHRIHNCLEPLAASVTMGSFVTYRWQRLLIVPF